MKKSNFEVELYEHCGVEWKKRLLIATPTLGLLRMEWSLARFGQIQPVNWESSGMMTPFHKPGMTYSPIGFSVEDAYNKICQKAMELGVEWLITIEDDVLLPQDAFVKFSHYMNDKKFPIVSGLYYLKATPTVPLVFRGRGTGPFTKFEIGDKVLCDGIPMGCLLIHMSVIRWFWENTETYRLPTGEEVKRIFITPRQLFFDPQSPAFCSKVGTQDLDFCDRVIGKKVLEKTGWKKIAKRKYPFLCDTGIFCRHIDLNTGKQYP